MEVSVGITLGLGTVQNMVGIGVLELLVCALNSDNKKVSCTQSTILTHRIEGTCKAAVPKNVVHVGNFTERGNQNLNPRG